MDLGTLGLIALGDLGILELGDEGIWWLRDLNLTNLKNLQKDENIQIVKSNKKLNSKL